MGGGADGDGDGSTDHGLQVYLRVPVGVEQYDDVSSRQVDAETAGAS